MTHDAGDISCAAQLLSGTQKIVCFTGAGISAESGIPTFRESGGIWEKYPLSLFGNILGLTLSFFLFPSKFLSFISDFVEAIVKAEPNSGHIAIAEMERVGIITSVITQNIDGLHEASGSRNVYNVHGSIHAFRCIRCGERTRTEKNWLFEAR